MTGQDKNLEKNKARRGRPASGRGHQVNLIMPTEMVRRIDLWASEQPGKPKRTEAVRLLVGIGLARSCQ